MVAIPNESIQLVVTSPPYPMIEMWDEMFASMDPEIGNLMSFQPEQAFENMHRILDQVWAETFRVLAPGGFCCINIGDATRSINGNFRLFSNHSRIIQSCTQIGFTNLPPVIWRKPTNAPNKFMGSGMLPAGAYITYEHEYILVFRKGVKRDFNSEALRRLRNSSAYFWEERNIWFSDLWQLNGIKQSIYEANRSRSAAFPLELPYRLINMYSVYGDNVLDPFMGTGTTAIAAMITGRNSTGFETDQSLKIYEEPKELKEIVSLGNRIIKERLQRHLSFVQDRIAAGKDIKHRNEHYGFPVMTAQERQGQFFRIAEIKPTAYGLQVDYVEIKKDLSITADMKATA
jgi:DNA modification methylase